MSTLTLFLMTRKGYQLLADTVDTFRDLFAKVVVGRDATLDDDYAEQTIALCERHGIAWTERSQHREINTDYAMAVGWRWMIDFPEDRLIVFHDSLLPRYRGFNPLVSALINGDDRVGVTALLGASEYDAGPILAQASMEVAYPCTIARAIDDICACYRDAALAVFPQLAQGSPLQGVPQDDNAATYSLWRDEEDYRIDWHGEATRLVRHIDALGSPYAGARTLVNGTLARVGRAQALPDVPIENRTPGKVIRVDNGLPVVVCGRGLLKITELTDIASGESLLPLAKFRSRFA
ncbi:methionyl-tRNA formyltransferase [Pandoraea sp. ISTKB]|uniref:methionyl-tRNA formyltransferase n=1 Tax=Pandoraea sp. ISTKB TaxID=1586708 RepID=UPI0009F36F0C|nr:formyltransferase family protein [Pandoraea sp. ISTKB]